MNRHFDLLSRPFTPVSNGWSPWPCYCGSMPASLIEAVHFTSSDLTKASKSWGPLQ